MYLSFQIRIKTHFILFVDEMYGLTIVFYDPRMYITGGTLIRNIYFFIEIDKPYHLVNN